MDFKRFYLEKGSVPSIYAKPKDSLGTDYPRNEGRLANRFFSRTTLFGRFFGTTETTLLWDLTRNVSIQNPPPSQKNQLLFELGRPIRNMFSIFQNDKIHDLVQKDGPILEPYRVQRRHAKLKPTTIINCKNRYFLGVREKSQDKTPPPKRL